MSSEARGALVAASEAAEAQQVAPVAAALDKIAPGLFLGNAGAAEEAGLLHRLGIGATVNFADNLAESGFAELAARYAKEEEEEEGMAGREGAEEGTSRASSTPPAAAAAAAAATGTGTGTATGARYDALHGVWRLSIPLPDAPADGGNTLLRDLPRHLDRVEALLAFLNRRAEEGTSEAAVAGADAGGSAARAATGVLFHCVSGINRSATLMEAWLMRRHRCTLRAASTWTSRRRPIIHPCSQYQISLLHYQDALAAAATGSDDELSDEDLQLLPPPTSTKQHKGKGSRKKDAAADTRCCLS